MSFSFLASFILLAISFGVAFINMDNMSNVLVIHLDSYKGIDFFGDKNDILSILAFGALVIALNGILANTLYLRERFLSYVLAFSSALFSLLIFMGILAIISIN